MDLLQYAALIFQAARLAAPLAPLNVIVKKLVDISTDAVLPTHEDGRPYTRPELFAMLNDASIEDVLAAAAAVQAQPAAPAPPVTSSDPGPGPAGIASTSDVDVPAAAAPIGESGADSAPASDGAQESASPDESGVNPCSVE